MSPLSWFKDCFLMMQRTKPQYLSVLGRKRSSLRSPEKLLQEERSILKSCVCVVIMLCSVCYGLVLLMVPHAPMLTSQTMLVPLVVAAVAAMSGGLCVSEYMSTQTQEVPSIYSCCYQQSSEVLAFFAGWSWLLSQAALAASLCSATSSLIGHWTGDAVGDFLRPWLGGYADAVPAAAFAASLAVLVVTGVSETLAWFVLLVPVAFVSLLASFAATRASNKEDFFLYGGSWFELQSLEQILAASSVCVLLYSGPQSLLRITQRQIRQKTTAVLGPFNAVCFVIVLGLLFMTPASGQLFGQGRDTPPAILVANNVVQLVCLCILGLESLYPLHFLVEDMASDGLLYRNLAKKWKPFCLSVASGPVQVLSVVTVSVLVLLMSPESLLKLSVVFPLLVNSLVPFLVLIQRYRDHTAWQYEPMFQTTARSIRDQDRRRSQESQYTNGVGFDHTEDASLASTACIAEDSAEDTDSGTDIDSVVQQYRDQAKIAKMPLLQEHDPAKQVPEPTPASSFRAALAISAVFLATVTNAIAMNIGNVDDRFIFVAVGLASMLVATIFQGLLLCLPQNGATSASCCIKIPRMPWIPGLSALVNMCLFGHCLIGVWKVYFGWFVLGLLVYFSYGIRSSTAANSFHNLYPAHIKLRPIPSYGNRCVPQVVPSQRKKNGHANHIKRKPLMA